MGCDMAAGRKPGGKGGKGGKRRGKRRRWAIRRHSRPPELILPPQLRTALGLKEPVDPRWFAAADRELVEYHKRYDAGDKSAVLDAIEIMSCFFPPWLREAYMSARMAHLRHAVATLDEAFGVERPRGKHLTGAREREMLRGLIMFRVYCLHRQEGAPLDDTTFARVADELGTSTTTIRRIFSEPESDEPRELLRNLPFSD
jgi:hypothetical protein